MACTKIEKKNRIYTSTKKQVLVLFREVQRGIKATEQGYRKNSPLHLNTKYSPKCYLYKKENIVYFYEVLMGKGMLGAAN